MSGISDADIEQVYGRVVRLAAKLGGDVRDWHLVAGSMDEPSRLPWVINDKQNTLVILGYTKRSAFSALLSMASFGSVLLGA